MSAMNSAKATVAATTAVASPLPLGMSPSRYPSSRGFPLRPPSLSAIAAESSAEEVLIEDVLCRVGTIRTPLPADFIHPKPAKQFAKGPWHYPIASICRTILPAKQNGHC